MPSTAHFKQRIVIIQEHLPHYRKRFFMLLREALAAEGIDLRLIHGQAKDSRMMSESLDWANPVQIRKIGPFAWHCLGDLCAGAELIIVPQEVKYLRCHWLHLMSRLGGAKFAYWGHGRNFQATDARSLAECCKRFLSRHVDWWFAYNALSAEIVKELGFPEVRITTVGNAIDTAGLTTRRAALDPEKLLELRGSLGLPTRHVAVYTGGLYSTKRIPFLLEAAKLIRQRIPDFHLLVIGDGPEQPLVQEAAVRFPWIHELGPMDVQAKVPYWALADVLLMPGGVGLVILDSFALGVPMVTTDTRLHGPEIDYLENGINGLLVPCGDSVAQYADAVAALLRNSAALDRIARGARASASQHALNGMVERFKQGVLSFLFRHHPV
jgi:glycosyltransferase involved in cell wall biosynthesis